MTSPVDAQINTARALADGLFPHQVEGVAFLLGRRRAILADDMGLGKTRQTIVSLRYVSPAGPYLVVCPASVKRNWAREIELVASDTSILVIEGAAPVAPTATFVTEARQALAVARTPSTLDFVRGAIEQGEKVIVFSCFDGPIQKLAKELGPASVVLTGKTPGALRQGVVDRFQQDEEVRVFLANIIAGGAGVNLTAATQVVFNDLDWVPTNHWQAEDRAYRIGQTRTVNVTYFVAENTIDDVVHAVLETKAAIVSAIVEGEAIAGDLGGDVLDELQRALHSVSSGLADAPDGVADDDLVARLVKEASAEFRARHESDAVGPAARRNTSDVEAFERALERLAKVLSGSPSRRFRIASTSHDGLEYEIVVVDADVTCTCAGFAYRGQCRHARDIKAAMASGQDVPAPYVEVR